VEVSSDGEVTGRNSGVGYRAAPLELYKGELSRGCSKQHNCCRRRQAALPAVRDSRPVAWSERRVTTFRIDDELMEAMEFLKDRDGVAFSEQIRRALRLWFESKGVKVKAAPRRVQPRRKA